MICSHLSDFFQYIMYQCNYTMYNYVYDILGIEIESHAHDAFHYLLKTLQELGFPISQSKLVSPTKRYNCLGIIIDTKECTLSFSHNKLKGILGKYEHTLNNNEITIR